MRWHALPLINQTTYHVNQKQLLLYFLQIYLLVLITFVFLHMYRQTNLQLLVIIYLSTKHTTLQFLLMEIIFSQHRNHIKPNIFFSFPLSFIHHSNQKNLKIPKRERLEWRDSLSISWGILRLETLAQWRRLRARRMKYRKFFITHLNQRRLQSIRVQIIHRSDDFVLLVTYCSK